MHDMWNKLFDKVIFYEPDCINVGRMLDEEVNAIVEPLKESMASSKEYLEFVLEQLQWHTKRHIIS